MLHCKHRSVGMPRPRSVVVLPLGKDLQACIDELPKEGGTIILQKGRYYVGGPLTLPKAKVNIVGVYDARKGSLIVIIESQKDTPIFVVKEGTRLTFNNIKVTAVDTAVEIVGGAFCADTCYLQGSSTVVKINGECQCTFSNCLIENRNDNRMDSCMHFAAIGGELGPEKVSLRVTETTLKSLNGSPVFFQCELERLHYYQAVLQSCTLCTQKPPVMLCISRHRQADGFEPSFPFMEFKNCHMGTPLPVHIEQIRWYIAHRGSHEEQVELTRAKLPADAIEQYVKITKIKKRKKN